MAKDVSHDVRAVETNKGKNKESNVNWFIIELPNKILQIKLSHGARICRSILSSESAYLS